MKNNRIELHNILINLFDKKIYYQPPENIKMEYPCIRYAKDNINSKHADNIKYINKVHYNITVIDKMPDNEVIDKILQLPLTSYNRHYTSNGLHHDVISIYY